MPQTLWTSITSFWILPYSGGERKQARKMKLLLICALVAAVAADVSHLPSNQYLPPGSGPVQSYSAPVQSYSAPVQSYSAPVQSYSAPSQSYLAPAASAVQSYSGPSVESYNVAASAPVQTYSGPSIQSAPVASYESFESEPAPAHSFSSADGYRYKTNRRVVLRRHRREVPSSEYLPPVQYGASAPSSEYLPPVASAPAPVYSAAASIPVQSYSAPAVQSYSAPAVQSYSAPISAPVSYGSSSYNVAEPAPAHSFSSADGYRYKTNRRVVLRRHRREVPSSEYLPPVQYGASAPSSEYLPPVASAPAPVYSAAPSIPVQSYSAPAVQSYSAPAVQSYSAPISAPVSYGSGSYNVAASEPAPAHSFSSADGYRYKTQRRVIRRRKF